MIDKEKRGATRFLRLSNKKVKARIIMNAHKNYLRGDKQVDVLDLFCATGGDLPVLDRFARFITFIDANKDQLDGIARRVAKQEQYTNKKVNFETVQVDLANPPKTLKLAREKYKFINAQFGVHYIFDSEQSVAKFCDFVAAFADQKAVIVITTFDGDLLNDIFEGKDPYIKKQFANNVDSSGKLLTFAIRGQDVLLVSKKYNKFEDFGNKIGVRFLDFMGDFYDEYLVRSSVLTAQLKRVGFRLKDSGNMSQVNIFNNPLEPGRNNDEILIQSLYKFYVFQKA